MDLKTRIFDQVAAARTGDKTVNEATESILDLLSVLGAIETALKEGQKLPIHNVSNCDAIFEQDAKLSKKCTMFKDKECVCMGT